MAFRTYYRATGFSRVPLMTARFSFTLFFRYLSHDYNIYLYLNLCNFLYKKNSADFSAGCLPSAIFHHNSPTLFIIRLIFEIGRINLFDIFFLSNLPLHVPANRNTRTAFATLFFQTLLRFPILPELQQLFHHGRGELCYTLLCQG